MTDLSSDEQLDIANAGGLFEELGLIVGLERNTKK